MRRQPVIGSLVGLVAAAVVLLVVSDVAVKPSGHYLHTWFVLVVLALGALVGYVARRR